MTRPVSATGGWSLVAWVKTPGDLSSEADYADAVCETWDVREDRDDGRRTKGSRSGVDAPDLRVLGLQHRCAPHE